MTPRYAAAFQAPRPAAGGALTLLAVACVITIGVADGWRTAIVALFAAGAVLATGIRFSAGVAVALLLLTATLAVCGAEPTVSDRPHAHAALVTKS